ncbi:hypothetical protein MRX96_033784 [Rhipicephalus microplus]
MPRSTKCCDLFVFELQNACARDKEDLFLLSESECRYASCRLNCTHTEKEETSHSLFRRPPNHVVSPTGGLASPESFRGASDNGAASTIVATRTGGLADSVPLHFDTDPASPERTHSAGPRYRISPNPTQLSRHSAAWAGRLRSRRGGCSVHCSDLSPPGEPTWVARR